MRTGYRVRTRARLRNRLLVTLVFLLSLASGVLLAQSLPTQVLQLLQRDNTWTGKQTFMDLRVAVLLPADTADRIYTDGTDLFWDGTALTGSGSVTAPHNLLSTTHPDTLAASPPTRGDLVVANATPLWSRFAIGASGTFLRSTGTDPAWSTDGSTLVSLNATNIASGTLALARLPLTIGNAQIDAAAAIAWTKISKTGSSLADLTTRSAADLSSGTLADARLSALVSLFGTSVGTSEIDAGAITAVKLADIGCTPGQAMTWQLSGWTCATFGTGSGSVTSVALALPAFITVSGSPVTTSGTLTGTLATQTANTFFSGPSSAGPSAPTFRVIANADLPLSGVAAATYASVTVNTAGVVTAGTAGIDLTTQVGATILPFANGGTGLSTAADDTTMVSSGAAWQAKTLPNCTTTPLGYTTATNLFSCLTTLSGMTAVTSTTLTASTSLVMATLAASATAPTISSGFGTTPAIAANNGTAAFTVDVGTGGVATSGVVGLPTAATGWVCSVTNRTAVLGNVGDAHTVQIATTTTTATLENQTISTGAALAWTASDILAVSCFGY